MRLLFRFEALEEYTQLLNDGGQIVVRQNVGAQSVSVVSQDLAIRLETREDRLESSTNTTASFLCTIYGRGDESC